MVKAGDIVRAKVLEVDVPRKRISLTMRLDESRPACPQTYRAAPHRQRQAEAGTASEPRTDGAMGNAFAVPPCRS